MAGSGVRRMAGLLAVALGLLGCVREQDEQVVRVFAAQSLSAAFRDAAAAFAEIRPAERVALHFAGSHVLLAQLREGAPADVVATADERTMALLRREGLVEEPQVFARNQLVIAVPRGNPAGVRGAADLTRPGLRLVLAGEAVPAGAYAREALAQAGVLEGALANTVSHEESVGGVLAKVTLGEADAGVVYATDVRAAKGAAEALPLPGPEARYSIAAVKGGKGAGSARARAFVAFVQTGEGRQALAGAGFLPP